MADCNPDVPHHWLKRRADQGKTLMAESRHEDNPTLFQGGQLTVNGAAYMGKLDALTGVRHQRLRRGLWVAAEGLVYDEYDPAVHQYKHIGEPPHSWPRYWVVDFGFTNPFVWQAWAQDPDGRLYMYREIYRTKTLVEDHAKAILKALPKREPQPMAIICDHDAEDRATLERHLGMGTIAAKKSVSDGIQAVQARLRVQGDGKPRLFICRDALTERDQALEDARRPTCTQEEIVGYVWDTSGNKAPKEAPLKDNDHGMDCARYVVAHLDLVGEVGMRWL
jgi:phage terminase large subunit